MKTAHIPVLATIVAAFLLLGLPGAKAQPVMTPEKVTAPVHGRHAARVTSSAHVYLMRGLMNIFSLGMDDLAQKLERRGIAASVYNHSEWQSVSDEIAAKYRAGNRGAIILIGHSLGADAVMMMGDYLGKKGVPVALIVPFDGTGSYQASANVARVLNITQRDYAYMRRGPGFHGELVNFDVSRDHSIDHISIDKAPRLHAMVIAKIMGIVGGRRTSSQTTASPSHRDEKPAAAAAAGATAKSQSNGTSIH
jgi:hypothetical protein